MANPTIRADKMAKIEAVREAARAKFKQRTSVMAASSHSLSESETGVSAPVSVSDFIAQHGLDGE